MNNTTTTGIVLVGISQDIKLALYIVFLVLGLVGNATLITVLIRRTTFKDVFEILVLNLAAADTLFHLLYIAPNIHRFADKEFQVSTLHCKFLYPFATVVYSSEIFTITAMSLHRYWVVVYSYKAKPTARAAAMWIMIIWICSVVVAVPLIIVSKPVLPGNCHEVWPSLSHRQAFTVALFLIQYALPLVVIAAAYLRVVLFLLKDPGSQVSRMNLQVVKTTAVIVIIFAICMLPSQLSWIIVDFAQTNIDMRTLHIMWNIGDLALCLHATLDPVVYGIFVKRFRKDYIYCFWLFFFCCRKDRLSRHLRKPKRLKNRTQERNLSTNKQDEMLLHDCNHTSNV